MLKTVSSIANAIGALNYKGTWNASTNTPTLTSASGTKGDYYVVSVAGSTALDGISNWGVGDWVAFNGTAWQRVEGGADLNGVNLSVSGNSTLDGNVIFKDNLTQETAGKGINFTKNTAANGMTSQLLNWYEDGTFTPGLMFGAGTTGITYAPSTTGKYTRIGRQVTVTGAVILTNKGSSTGQAQITGLPFNVGSDSVSNLRVGSITSSGTIQNVMFATANKIFLYQISAIGVSAEITDTNFANDSALNFSATYFV